MAIPVTTYLIEPRLSRFSVQAFAGGFLSGFGHNPTIAIRDFTGQATFSPEAPAESSVTLNIRAESLEVTNDVSDKDRREIERTMKEDVIQTSRFPDIIYQGRVASISELGPSRYRVNLDGTLSLHGVSRNQQLAADISVNNGLLRGFGNFSVLQTNFDIKLVSVAGGSLKVKDELKCSFDIGARSAEDSGKGAGS